MTEEKIEAPQAESSTEALQFPTPKGDGISQFDPKTGFIWIGINIAKFPEKDAQAFIRSQEFMIAQIYTQMAVAAQQRMKLAAPPPNSKNNGGWLPKFMRAK